MQYTTLTRERKGSIAAVSTTQSNVSSWFSSLKRVKKGKNHHHKNEPTSKSAWDLTTLSTLRALVCVFLIFIKKTQTPGDLHH